VPLRDGYIPGVPCWVDVSTPDPEAGRAFYSGLFGWEFEDVKAPSSEGEHHAAQGEARSTSIFDLSGETLRGYVAGLRSLPEGAPEVASWNTYFWVDDADQVVAKVRDAGGTVVRDPFDFMGACRLAYLTDAEGATFGLWQEKGAKGAQLVNDPGALVFNNLNTREVESAKDFYGSVFGWRTGPIGGGAEGWTLPGYGDWLEREHHPGLREQMAQAGAPDGFADVVGSIVPIGDDQPDAPSHWSVTFATDDADATAERAAELGGTVIVPPFDAPWSTDNYTIRLTVLADPQGATFSASRFLAKGELAG
jgi:uncharacterized protein